MAAEISITRSQIMKKIQQKPPKAPKAYKNATFLTSPEARIIRVVSEYLEPLTRFRREKIVDTIVFFGSARVLPRSITSKRLKKLRSNTLNRKDLSSSDKLLLDNALVDYEMSRYYEEGMELSYLLTKWSRKLDKGNRFVICSGGGPGIMEAANKGATMAGGKSIGLNISLPHEQFANSYISLGLNFEFHYFFMRKLWFMSLARAMVMFPGGFGTIDEMMEILTLIQTRKATKHLPMVLYGQEYWEKVLNFTEMLKYRTISKKDFKLFTYANSPKEAFEYIKNDLTKHHLKDISNII
jgi:uncharacterized protein (TIGR00730 family)